MADKDSKKGEAKNPAIAKTLNKVEERLDMGERSDSVAEGLANVAKASELLSSVWTLPPGQLLRFHHDTKVAELDGGIRRQQGGCGTVHRHQLRGNRTIPAIDVCQRREGVT